MTIKNEKDFTFYCCSRTTGIMQATAANAFITGQSQLFVSKLIQQDSNEGSRSGTKRVLGPTLYKELQKFKTHG